jgi:hypothetical protein
MKRLIEWLFSDYTATDAPPQPAEPMVPARWYEEMKAQAIRATGMALMMETERDEALTKLEAIERALDQARRDRDEAQAARDRAETDLYEVVELPEVRAVPCMPGESIVPEVKEALRLLTEQRDEAEERAKASRLIRNESLDLINALRTERDEARAAMRDAVLQLRVDPPDPIHAGSILAEALAKAGA